MTSQERNKVVNKRKSQPITPVEATKRDGSPAPNQSIINPGDFDIHIESRYMNHFQGNNTSKRSNSNKKKGSQDRQSQSKGSQNGETILKSFRTSFAVISNITANKVIPSCSIIIDKVVTGHEYQKQETLRIQKEQQLKSAQERESLRDMLKAEQDALLAEQVENTRKREEYFKRTRVLKAQIQHILDDQKLVELERIHQNMQIERIDQMMRENEKAIDYIDKYAIKEIKGYVTLDKFYTTMKILCILLDKSQWDAKAVAKFDRENVLATAKQLFSSVSLPFQKLLANFESESISREKAQYLVDLVEETDFSVEKVSIASHAMSFLAKWELGIIHQRRLQFYCEPLLSKLKIKAEVIARLPRELQRRQRAIVKIKNEIYNNEEVTDEQVLRDLEEWNCQDQVSLFNPEVSTFLASENLNKEVYLNQDQKEQFQSSMISQCVPKSAICDRSEQQIVGANGVDEDSQPLFVSDLI